VEDNKMGNLDVGSSGKDTTVLVVDDEQHTTLMIHRLLAQAGYRPVATTNLFQASRLVASQSPDLVLLDISLPGTNGFELFREIREHSKAPIIFFTASDREEDIKQAEELGAADYITKPFHPPNCWLAWTPRSGSKGTAFERSGWVRW
jgi:DNA-binding response OmpR family regulator